MPEYRNAADYDCSSQTVPAASASEINPLTPELNTSTRRCLPRFFTGDFKF
jgi:hypothetical protein